VDDRVVVAGRDGTIESRALATGALVCASRHAVGSDRAGPAVAGNLLVFVNLAGEVTAESRDVVASCAKAGQGVGEASPKALR
jgi:hypothetical protein